MGSSLKQISLSKTPLQIILEDISKYRSIYADILMQENVISSRFKCEDSIRRKYDKTLKSSEGVQIVILNHLDIYAEYSPYNYIDDMKEFIDR